MGASKIRIPDVPVTYADEAMTEEVRLTAPLIAIEVLSPEDRIPRVLVRLDEFRKMGILYLWLLDPEERIASVDTAAGLKQVEGTRLEIAGSPIYLDLEEVLPDSTSRSAAR